MNGTSVKRGLNELLNLWNYSLSQGATNLFTLDAPYVYLEVGRVALTRLEEEGTELVKKTPLETINAVFDYFTECGFFKEVRVRRVDAGEEANGDLYEIFESGCVVFESNCWAFGNHECRSPACFCYNLLRYVLVSSFGLDIQLTDITHDAAKRESRLNIRLVPVPKTPADPKSILDELRSGNITFSDVLDVYRKTVDMSLDAIVSADERGRITLWNSAAEKTFGYSAREAVGAELSTIVPEQYRAMHKEGFERFLATGTGPLIGRLTEVEGRRKDGSLVPIELSLSAEHSGNKWAFTAVIRDITDKKKAEEALSESDRRYTELFNGVKDIVYSLDRHGTVTVINPAIKRLGYEPDEVVGRPLVDFVSDAWRARTQKELGEAVKHGIKVGETVLLGRDHTEYYVEYSSIAVKDGAEAEAVRGIMRDITDRKRLERELKEKLEYVERLNRLMVGRELKMEELRTEIRGLRERLGKG